MSDHEEQTHHTSSDEEDVKNLFDTQYAAQSNKTLQELQELDAGDESLKKWKESLCSFQATGALAEVVPLALFLVIEGRPNIEIDISSPELVEACAKKEFSIKENTEYSFMVRVRVQNDIVHKVLCKQKVSKLGKSLLNDNFVLGSFGPRPEPQEIFVGKATTPSGMLARLVYNVHTILYFQGKHDDPPTKAADVRWRMKIVSDWDKQ